MIPHSQHQSRRCRYGRACLPAGPALSLLSLTSQGRACDATAAFGRPQAIRTRCSAAAVRSVRRTRSANRPLHRTARPEPTRAVLGGTRRTGGAAGRRASNEGYGAGPSALFDEQLRDEFPRRTEIPHIPAQSSPRAAAADRISRWRAGGHGASGRRQWRRYGIVAFKKPAIARKIRATSSTVPPLQHPTQAAT